MSTRRPLLYGVWCYHSSIPKPQRRLWSWDTRKWMQKICDEITYTCLTSDKLCLPMVAMQNWYHLYIRRILRIDIKVVMDLVKFLIILFLALQELLRIHTSLQWRHNGCDGASDHHPHECLLKLVSKRRSKKTLKLCVTGLCEGNSPAQRASNAEDVSIWWRHHGFAQKHIWLVRTHNEAITYKGKFILCDFCHGFWLQICTVLESIDNDIVPIPHMQEMFSRNKLHSHFLCFLKIGTALVD